MRSFEVREHPRAHALECPYFENDPPRGFLLYEICTIGAGIPWVKSKLGSKPQPNSIVNMIKIKRRTPIDKIQSFKYKLLTPNWATTH